MEKSSKLGKCLSSANSLYIISRAICALPWVSYSVSSKSSNIALYIIIIIYVRQDRARADCKTICKYTYLDGLGYCWLGEKVSKYASKPVRA